MLCHVATPFLSTVYAFCSLSLSVWPVSPDSTLLLLIILSLFALLILAAQLLDDQHFIKLI